MDHLKVQNAQRCVSILLPYADNIFAASILYFSVFMVELVIILLEILGTFLVVMLKECFIEYGDMCIMFTYLHD